jgi:outer membrane lipoprotein-sorting protein
MKNVPLALLLLVPTLGFQLTAPKEPALTPNAVLQAIHDKLNAISEVQYDYYRDVNYRSENHHSELSGSTYLDFRATENVTGFRFQIVSPAYRSIYNGQSLFSTEEDGKKLIVFKQPARSEFTSMSFFYNSPVTLRNTLAKIITDTTIPKVVADTIISGKAYDKVRFALKSQTLQNLGGFSKLTTDLIIFYTIMADKQSHLPFAVVQTNSETPQDYVLTRFTNVKINTQRPDEKTWHYINYVNDYKTVYRN